MDHFTDRRHDPKQKSLGNRQRFLQRSKEEVRKGVADAISKGNLKDVSSGKGGKVKIKRTEEPSFQHDGQSGRKWFVITGNGEYIRGDSIPIPENQGGGSGSQGSPDGEGDDDFTFTLTEEEFIDLFLGDLKLPYMTKRSLDRMKLKVRTRTGFSKTGSPATLDKERTMINSIGRRIALKRPSPEAIEALEEQIRALQALEDQRSEEEEQDLKRLHEALQVLRKRRAGIPYIEPEIDPMYRSYTMQPKPTTQAVLFCLMDKSASMTEPLKDLAKRFFMLLLVFLKRYYKEVEIVFISHTSSAQEVDEHTFFYGTETGGTVISTALAEMQRVIKDRYDPAVWNIYAAQASDGDNVHDDMENCEKLLTEGAGSIMELVQYYAYIETVHGERYDSSETPVWRVYAEIRKRYKHFGMKMVASPDQIFPVFRDLFSEEKK